VLSGARRFGVRFGNHGYPLWFHGISWSGKPHWSHRQPCHRAVDFIEEMHEKGEPLERALPDAGIERIRPVMITVGATILALFPLALEGGPLWKPLCYAQIGGLAVATFITLLLVPVFYAIFVLDLKWIKWETPEKREQARDAEPTTT
jgi:predicted RND superfamily exporter protein